jgi:hypothetical protein
LKLTSPTRKKGDEQSVNEERGRKKMQGKQIVTPHNQNDGMEIEELEDKLMNGAKKWE